MPNFAVPSAAARRCRGHAVATAALLACVAGGSAVAATVAPVAPSVVQTFVNVENRSINSLGFAAGTSVRFGADAVVPNGANGTTGVARTTNTVTGAAVSRTIAFGPGPLIPNFFSGRMAYNPGLLGAWTLSFTNAGATTTVTKPALPAGTGVLPFVDTITLSGTSSAPTFTWAAPAGHSVQGYRINIYDKTLVGPGNNGQVMSRNLASSVNSYTVSPADFTVPGYGMQMGRAYAIEIVAMQTRDGTSSSLSNANLASASRVFADFTPRAGGDIVVNLPVLTSTGAFAFNLAVAGGGTYYLDPTVAVGYDYEIGLGDPNFASVVVPDAHGDGVYRLWGWDANGTMALLDDSLLVGEVHDFGPDGITRFRIDGIETSAMLDPTNTTAFVTGVTFTGNGRFTGTQTPLTADVALPGTVPEPTSAALAAVALAAVGGLRRRRPAGHNPRS